MICVVEMEVDEILWDRQKFSCSQLYLRITTSLVVAAKQVSKQ